MPDVSFARSGQFSIGTVLATSCRLAWRNIGAILLISVSIQTYHLVPADRERFRDIGFSAALAQVYSWTDPEWANLVWSAMVTPWVVFSMSAGCFVITAAYHLIRNEQEGPAPEALVRVFD